MSNRRNHTIGLDLSAVAPSQRADRRVRWNPDMRPSALADTTGVVFMSKGRETFVIWDGATRAQLVFTGALILA